MEILNALRPAVRVPPSGAGLLSGNTLVYWRQKPSLPAQHDRFLEVLAWPIVFNRRLHFITQQIAGLAVEILTDRGQGFEPHPLNLALSKERQVGLGNANMFGKFA